MVPFHWLGGFHLAPIGLGIIFTALLLRFAAKLETYEAKDRLATQLSYLFILVYVWITIAELITGVWGLNEGLPLHLCDIASWTLFFALRMRLIWLMEAGFYWGMTGALLGLLFPELEVLDIYYVPFFVWHIALFAAPLFLMYAFGFRPSQGGLWKTWGFTFVVALPAAFADWLVPKANYMFLDHPPLAAAILPFPAWPFYLPLMAIMLLPVFYLFWFTSRYYVISLKP